MGFCNRTLSGQHVYADRAAKTDFITGRVVRTHLACVCGHVPPESEVAAIRAALAATEAERARRWGIERGASQLMWAL